jgi:hypothetical protein
MAVLHILAFADGIVFGFAGSTFFARQICSTGTTMGNQEGLPC